VKGTRAEARSINSWLETLNARAHSCRQELYAGGKAFTATHIRKLMQGEELEPPRMLSEAWNYHVAHIAGLLGKDYSLATMKKYGTAYKALQKFLLQQFKSIDIRLDKLDHRFVKEYEYYLKADYGVKNNTAVGMIKKLRTVIRIAMDFGWLLRDPFIAHRMKTTEVHRNYLSGPELNALVTRKFRGRRLRRVRDLFLFSCYTGLSYADTQKLTAADLFLNEAGEQWIETHRVKNNNRVRLPLLAPALALINYYCDQPGIPEGKLLPQITNQRANQYLKDIARDLGLKKHLTFHCARHTFATTVTLTNGVPMETVGQMLGHKNIRSTQLYARVTDTKVAADMEPLREKFKGVRLELAGD